MSGSTPSKPSRATGGPSPATSAVGSKDARLLLRNEPERDRQDDVDRNEGQRERTHEPRHSTGVETGHPSRQRPGDDPDGRPRQNAGHGQEQRHAPEAGGREPGDLPVGQAVEQDEFEEDDGEEARGKRGRPARRPPAQVGEGPPQQPQAAEGGARPDPVEQPEEQEGGDSRDRALRPVVHQVGKRNRPAEEQRAEQQTCPQVAAAGDRHVQPPAYEGSRATTFGHGPG